MQGIGPGTVLGGRYTADQLSAPFGDGELWTARDSILDRSVLLVVVSRQHPNVAAFLDAARRVAGLDNIRLSRILDVGSDDEVSYVVEESLEGSHTLAELLQSGPLPAPEVRRMAGETSLVLDVARNRGLHHQRLTPQHVLRTQDGDVKVRGLATLAALAGVDDVPDHEASREDAKGVVAIAYAGFTGLWPLPGDSGGLDPAPRVANHVAAPSEIAASVPADLDALCRLTFANDQGPTTPGDFARQVAPWSPIPILLPSVTSESPVTRHDSPLSPAAPPADPEVDEPTVVRSAIAADRPEDTSGPDVGPAPDAERDSRPDDVGDDDRVADGVHDDGASDDGAPDDGAPDDGAPDDSLADDPTADQTDDTDDEPTRVSPVVGAGAAAAGAAGAAAAAAASAGRGPGPDADVPVAHRIPAPGDPATPARGTTRPGAASPADAGAGAESAALGPSPVAAMGAKTAAALGAAGTATAGAAKALGDRFSDWSTQAKERSKAAAEERQKRKAEIAAQRAEEQGRRAEEEAARAEEWDESDLDAGHAAAPARPAAMATSPREPRGDELEPPAPLLPASAAEPLTRDQSRMAIGIILGFIVVALGLAMWGLSKVPSLPGLPDLSDTSVASPPPTTDPDATEDGTATDEGTGDGPGDQGPTTTPGQPLTFTDAIDYDPLGDVEERPEQIPNIIDGDPDTFWNSMGYQNTAFSGLKDGMGVILDLGESSSLSEVTLELPLANTGQIYVTDDETYFSERPPLGDDVEPVGEFTGPGTTSVELAEGTAGRYVVVWFTNTVQVGEWHRAQLAGASATS